MNLIFPSSPDDGQVSNQPNGVSYVYDDAKKRWDQYAVPGPGGSSLNRQTVIAADTTFVPDPRCVFIRIWVTGGGGGGGGITCDVDKGAMSRGGSGGATAIWWGKPDPSYAIVIGAGGLKGSAGANNGQNGEDSTVISASISLVGGGGLLGQGSGATTTSNRVGVVGGGNAGGGGGLLNIPGGDCSSGAIINDSPGPGPGSGGSWWGPGRLVFRSNGCPDNAADHAGIGGMGNSVRHDSVNRSGGGGGKGRCVIEEWLALH